MRELSEQLYQRCEMAMALLQPQRQRQQQESWFFFDFEDDGVYELDVDMVGSGIQKFSLLF